MIDLISRSELLKEIEAWGGCVEALHEYIQNMPTAYDIDKVVGELEHTMSNSGLPGEIIWNNVLKMAIEIVKQNCVSDVCEWKLEDEEANLYLTGCQQRQLIFDGTPKENGYRYCPYCGKKIRVV